MSKDIKNFIKFISGVILLLVILYVIFGQTGIASTTFNYMQFAEPLVLQTSIVRAISVASYSPGEFTVMIKSSGRSHELEISEEDEILYLDVRPAQQSMLKTDFVGIEKVPLITNCEIEPQVIILGEDSTIITVDKIITEEGCSVVLS